MTGVQYTLSSYMQYWYDNIFSAYTTAPSYLQTTKWAIEKIIIPSMENDHLLIDITPDYINEILQKCAKSPYRTAASVSRKLLCVILKTAEMEDLLNLNFSFNNIVHFQRVPPKYVAYKKEDLRKLLEIAKRHDNIYLEILLCLFCGLRIMSFINQRSSSMIQVK